MEVLGIDPSLTSTGLALVQPQPEAPALPWWRLTTVKTKPPGGEHLAAMRRLQFIVASVGGFLRENDVVPDLAVIEAPAFSKNVGMAHERAGLWWALYTELAAEMGLPVLVIKPNLRAKYATGSGTAGKDEVMLAAARRYAAPIANNNEADALLLAAMGARLAGHAVEPSLPAANVAALRTLSVPQASLATR